MTQMTIDLGGPPQKTCKTCGMEYMPANEEDTALHRKFHASSVGGVDVPVGYSKGLSRVRESQRKISRAARGESRGLGKRRQKSGGWDDEADVIVKVGRDCKEGKKRAARRILEVAEKELGSIPLGEEELWGQVIMGARTENATDDEQNRRESKPENRSQGSIENEAGDERPAENRRNRHDVFLYLQQNKCIGLCLAERIRCGRAVLPEASKQRISTKSEVTAKGGLPSPPQSSPSAQAPPMLEEPVTCRLSETLKTAKLGISKIWVSREFRGLGVANDLLFAAQESFLGPGKILEREEVAFSQPTNAGTKLAKSWFRSEDGWLVYNDGCLFKNVP